MELLIGAAALLGIFGPLSLIAWVIKKAIARRARRRRINRMFASLPLRQERPAESPRSPRVLYVPKHDDEAHEPDLFVPLIVPTWGWDAARPEAERTEVFVGKGGASGGAGASDTWEPTAPVIEETVREEPTTESFDTTTATPDVSSEVQEA